MEHRRIEKEFRCRLLRVCPSEATLEFPHIGLPPDRYLQRNIFSILFLSVLECVGIPAPRRRHYGLLLHAVRGIVTATDNIIDRHEKGSVRLAAARDGVDRIGLGLQVLDDITDLAEDIGQRNHNMLRSWVIHHGPERLHGLGHPIDRSGALDLIRVMFELRGLGHLWALHRAAQGAC